MALTKVTNTMIDGAALNVLDYGASTSASAADNATAFNAAFSAAASGTQSVYIPDGTYNLASPIRTTAPIRVFGRNVTLRAATGFTGIDFTDGGGTTNVKAILIFNPSNVINDISGPREFGAYVDDGILLDCNYNGSNGEADYGLFVERMPRSKYCCDVDGAEIDGIKINYYNWGVHLCNNSISSSGRSGISLQKAFNGGLISNCRIFRGDTGVEAIYGIINEDVADNNGITITGGYIQDCTHAFYFGSRCGPVMIEGMDIENLDGNVIRAIGDPITGREAMGPIVIKGSYLQAEADSKIYASDYYVAVENCRFRYSDAGFKDFETPGGSNAAVIVASNNQFETDGPLVVDDSNVRFQVNEFTTSINNNYVATRSVTYGNDYSIYNYAFRDDMTLQSSGLRFANSFQGGVNERYISKSEWFTNDYSHGVTPGVLDFTTGVFIHTDTDAFAPMTDNRIDCGSASFRWDDVYATNATIQTSDANDKQDIAELSEAESRVALAAKSLVKKFRWKSSVAEKGDNARTHFGVIAQDLQAAFEAEGLDARDYAVFVESVWYEDADGNPVSEELEGAIRQSRLGVRYNELLAFIISAL